ncbi:MAG TPA: hypothetical protein DCW60_00705 [Sutterella sp.]|nr:hypothetical protein [Sutterella sp.]
MAYDLEEQESLEELKAWWGKWGTPIMAAVTVVCLGFAGLNGYRWYEAREAQNASVAYQSLQNALGTGAPAEQVGQIANQLRKDYASTVFASLAALRMAKFHAETGAIDDAIADLNWVIESGKRTEFENLARLRLAGLYLDKKEASKAKAVLTAGKPTSADVPLFEDKLGDAEYALGNASEAKTHWEKARKEGNESGIRAYVELKLQALADKQ